MYFRCPKQLKGAELWPLLIAYSVQLFARAFGVQAPGAKANIAIKDNTSAADTTDVSNSIRSTFFMEPPLLDGYRSGGGYLLFHVRDAK